MSHKRRYKLKTCVWFVQELKSVDVLVVVPMILAHAGLTCLSWLFSAFCFPVQTQLDFLPLQTLDNGLAYPSNHWCAYSVANELIKTPPLIVTTTAFTCLGI